MGVKWENKCSRCGLCCHEKVVSGNTLVIDLDSWCEFYDPKSKQCTVYAKRFVECERCRKMTVWRAMFASYIPETCAYAEWARKGHIRFDRKRYLRLIHTKTCPAEDGEDSLYSAFGY